MTVVETLKSLEILILPFPPWDGSVRYLLFINKNLHVMNLKRVQSRTLLLYLPFLGLAKIYTIAKLHESSFKEKSLRRRKKQKV